MRSLRFAGCDLTNTTYPTHLTWVSLEAGSVIAERMERVLTFVLSIAAVLLAASAVRREFFSKAVASALTPAVATLQPDWMNALPVGIPVGNSTSPVTLVVFSDLECPACAAFHKTVKSVRRRYRSDLSLVFVHFPLSTHRFAIQAAQAAECADSAGRFEPFVDLVYDKQDSIGVKSWGSYARESGIADTALFANCARNAISPPRIQAGRELGLEWGIGGTPTVIINGRRFDRPPTANELLETIRAVSKDLGTLTPPS